MIKILPKKKRLKKIKSPYYTVKISYMIGDSNGYIEKSEKVNEDNPHLERFCTLIESLKPLVGHWGVSLSLEDLEERKKQSLISNSDYVFLLFCYFSNDEEELKLLLTDDDLILSDNYNIKDFYCFSELITSETEYSFLSFSELWITYTDEYKDNFKCEIVKD